LILILILISTIGDPMLTPDEIREALRPVEDPELRISIVALGLVREIKVIDDSSVHVDLTLTSPYCPLGPEILAEVKAKLLSLEAIEVAEVELVWEPVWDPAVDADEDVKALLGIWD
jgi:metal-sulfur cluster biosynthetic enzyme